MSVFSDISKFFKKVFGGSNWEKVTNTTIKLIAPNVLLITEMTAGEADAVEISKVVKEVQTDLTALAHTSDTAQAEGLVNSIEENLDSLLKAGHIKNPQTLAKVESIVTLILEEISAIKSAIGK